MAVNIETCALHLIKLLQIPIKAQLITDELEMHPNYPSLLALSDIFTYLKVENSAYHIATDDLINVPVPFIAHTTTKGSEFAVIEALNDKTVIITSEKFKSKTLSFNEFSKLFDGIILTIDQIGSDLTKSNKKWLFKISAAIKPICYALLIIALIAVLIIHTNYIDTLSWKIITLTFFKTLGLATAILLLIQSINNNNPLVQAVCQTGGKNDCNAILSSNAAKAFLGLTWSEVGFFYFAGTWLALLFNSQSVHMIQWLALLNIFSLPYTIYSIYYQAKTAKQWCMLCCTIQALLWLEFIPLITYLQPPSTFLNKNTCIDLLICILLPPTLWLLLKPLFLEVQQLPVLKSQLRKFKYNSELFNNTLQSQPKYRLPDKEWSIVLGNIEAEQVITMVSNTHCNACSKTHQQLCEWLDYRNDLQVRIVFNVNNNDDLKTPVVRHLMALNELADKSIIKNALNDWHAQKQKNFNDWTKAYPVDMDPANCYKLEKQRDWCEMASIKHTPTLFINGRMLPGPYQFQDIKYMLL